MAQIVLLALAAAVFPTLLACVAIMISRPQPRRLLLAFYAGGVLVSITAGVIVLVLLDDGSAVLGNTPAHSNPRTSIVLGLVALLLAWLMSSRPGQARLRRLGERRAPRPERGPSWAERHLSRANAAVAFAVGAAINLPGPFYLLALRELATGGYSAAAAFALIVLFNAIMFALLEVPLVGYALRPERTAELVARLAVWLNANGLRVMGWLIGAVGIGLVVQGAVATV